MLVSGIVIVVLVVAGVAVMFAVMQENADVAENVVEVADHSNERIKEEIVLTSDNATDLQLHSKGLDVARPAPAAQPNPSAGYKKPYKSASVGSSSGSSSIISGKAGSKKPIPKPAPKPNA